MNDFLPVSDEKLELESALSKPKSHLFHNTSYIYSSVTFNTCVVLQSYINDLCPFFKLSQGDQVCNILAACNP